MALFECAICPAIAGLMLVGLVGLVVVLGIDPLGIDPLGIEPFDRHWDR